MSKDTLQLFARQLEEWAAEELRIKPGPFRTVEALPSLLGKTEVLSPPIVLWVNRDSHLAGGVILLPKKDPTDVLASGADICAALGLDCYYTWGIGEVAAWQVNGSTSRLWTEPLPAVARQDAATFRQVLSVILQNMQNRFFNSPQRLPQLSALYLTNLLYHCVESSLSIAIMPAAETAADTTVASTRHALAGIIVQMLSLLSQSSLPARTSPDSIVNDLRRESATLTPPLATGLNLLPDPPRFPPAVNIKLHHLYQRLQQLGPGLLPCIPEAVNRLLKLWAETAQLAALPAELKKNSSTLIINPDRYHPEMSVSIEVAPPPLPAATALLRHMQSRDRRHPVQFLTLLDCRSLPQIDTIIGSLNDRTRVPATVQRTLNTQLRSSWPNRQLKITPSAPLWTWHFIHLVGLLQGTPHGILKLPADWLWAPYGDQLFTLFSERCALSRIGPCAEAGLRIEFNHPADGHRVTIDSFDNDVRRLDNQNKDVSRTDLLLALSLPAPVYDLIRSNELKVPGEVQHAIEAIELYMRSSLGRGLWQILAPKKQLPKKANLMAEIIRIGLPLPTGQALTALARLARNKGQTDPASIDRELEVWLGPSCRTVFHARFRSTAQATDTPAEINPARDIAAALIAAGSVPAFPQDYLYSITEKDRQTFHITGPLHCADSFFNTVTLQAPDSVSLQVEGHAKARALQIISAVQSGHFELPAEDQTADIILDRYLRDLQTLYNRLLVESSQPGPAAKKLADSIWDQLPVPPRDVLDGN